VALRQERQARRTLEQEVKRLRSAIGQRGSQAGQAPAMAQTDLDGLLDDEALLRGDSKKLVGAITQIVQKAVQASQGSIMAAAVAPQVDAMVGEFAFFQDAGIDEGLRADCMIAAAAAVEGLPAEATAADTRAAIASAVQRYSQYAVGRQADPPKPPEGIPGAAPGGAVAAAHLADGPMVKPGDSMDTARKAASTLLGRMIERMKSGK
jgi:hypothetical protein